MKMVIVYNLYFNTTKYTDKYVIHHLSLFVATDGRDADDGNDEYF
jgi:hypothetical protein